MKPTLLFSAFLITCGTGPAIAQDPVVILPIVAAGGSEKETSPKDDDDVIVIGEETDGDECEPEITEDPAPDDWFPGGWDPNWVRRNGGPEIYYTMGGNDEDAELDPSDPLPDVDPVIYQTGIPAEPKQSRKEKKAAIQADIANGCAVTFDGLDDDGDGSLNPREFAIRRPGAAKSNANAFRRADKNRNGLLSVAEFTNKGSAPLVMPASLDVLAANEARLSFNALDFDSNGFLTFGEFTAVLRPSGPGILEAIFAEADRNGDGKISFAEYTHRQIRPAGVE